MQFNIRRNCVLSNLRVSKHKSEITFDKFRNRCRDSKFTSIDRYDSQDIAAKNLYPSVSIICFLASKNEGI